MAKKQLTSEEKIKVLKDSFKVNEEDFISLCFSSYLTRKPAPFHRDLLQDYKKHQFIVRACPRGTAKTTMTDLFHLSWLIVTKQVKFVLLVSDTYGQASLFLVGFKG